jgi:RNA polymerase sigma factor for flagellar operon FliA
MRCQSPHDLIEGCQGLVRSLAAQIYRTLPAHVELEDLVAYGQVGVAEAARDFDPALGNEFSTYAYYRIRGAIYDGLSKMAWISRAHYHRIRYEQLANDVLQLDSDDHPQAEQHDMESDSRWLRNVSRALAIVYFSTLRRQPGEDDEALDLEDKAALEPSAALMDRELKQKLRELVGALPSEAGVLIRAVYFEGLTLQEAGQRIGVSKSWASRLHAKTLLRLARALKLMGVAF